MILALAWLLQSEPVALKFGGTTDDSQPVTVELTLTLKISGTDQIVNMVRSAEAFLNFEKIRVRGEGKRHIKAVEKGAVRYRLDMEQARVDGRYDDEDYEFDFSAASPPEGLDDPKKKLQQICWWLGMGGREYTLDPKGVYASNDQNQDAWGELLDYVGVGAVRLPEKPVAVGVEWESKWKTARKQKDNDGKYAVVQKAKVERVEKKDGRRRARISYAMTGDLEVAKERQDPNAKKSENKFEGSGWIEVDADSGFVIAGEGKGTVHAWSVFANSEGGEDHKLDLVATVESKIVPR